ncbi:transposase [Pseudomonas sp. IT-196MI5]
MVTTMNKHRTMHIGRYSQAGWEFQTTWEGRRKVAEAGLMDSINPRHQDLSNFIYRS